MLVICPKCKELFYFENLKAPFCPHCSEVIMDIYASAQADNTVTQDGEAEGGE